MKAIIKETGQAVEVVSRFMPKKRNAPSRAWVCVISDGRIIDEDAIEYIAQPHPVPDADTEAEPKEEKKLPEGLEKAAKHHSEQYRHHWPNQVRPAYDSFIAGAEWEREQERSYSPWLSIPNLEEASIEFGEQAKMYEIGGQTFSEDMAVAFTRGAEWQKAKMLEGAVEGEVENATFGIVYLRKNLANEGYSTGDKVRVIVIKEDK